MRIIFVRHGHPNYEKDCLTELGHLHAQAAAKRLEEETIAEVHASSCGRAAETAGYIAAPRGLTVVQHDFIREISWGSVDDTSIPYDGHPWSIADAMIAEGKEITVPNWQELELFRKSKLITNVQSVSDGFDHWLSDFGYEREGLYYRVRRSNDDTIAMVSHGGSSSAVMAHLFNLSFPFFCGTVHPDFTAITVISLKGEEGELIAPHVEIMNDCRHIAGITL